ncbi:hypothetical protein Scep_025894 [Stephania cephalantha]|uniref:Uncharacterized protein n=1 Tax=Stephania cephalantha TaxID=152367 RepID=A0AAP0HSV2_9MAGN
MRTLIPRPLISLLINEDFVALICALATIIAVITGFHISIRAVTRFAATDPWNPLAV